MKTCWKCLILLPLSVFASIASPLEKVVELLSNLKNEVAQEGAAENTTFANFSRFCASSELEKNQSIKTGLSSSAEISATIKDKSATLTQTRADLVAKRGEKEKLAGDQQVNKDRCAKQAKEWTDQSNDLASAIDGLNGAIKKLKGAGSPAFLQYRHNSLEIEKNLMLAEALGFLEESHHREMTAFLQQPWLEQADAAKNKADYAFRSDGIVATLNSLLTQFTTERTTGEANWAKSLAACSDSDKASTAAIAAKQDAIKAAEASALKLETDIAAATETLATTNKNLEKDKVYLTELKQNCADRTADFKQRAVLRVGEMQALDSALRVINLKVVAKAASVGNRTKKSLLSVDDSSSAQESSTDALAPISFLQMLRQGRLEAAARARAQQIGNAEQDAAVQLNAAGEALHSTRLSFLAMRIAQEGSSSASPADTLKSVKQMVQDLLGKLETDAQADQEKHVSCAGRLKKATTERDQQFEKVKAQNSLLSGQDSTRQELNSAVILLSEEVNKSRYDLQVATKLRSKESADNAQTLKDAKEGAAAIKEAIVALNSFYKKAAAASANYDQKAAQTKKPSFIQVDSDEESLASPSDPGFTGGYSGKQDSVGGIISMMDVIQSDFERSAVDVVKEEEAAAKEFNKLDMKSSEEISAKAATLSIKQEQLLALVNQMKQGKTEFERLQALLDGTLQTLEQLKKECVDSQETSEQRRAKLDQEVNQLKIAFCKLDLDGVEPSCKS
jgi:hypothetical protein